MVNLEHQCLKEPNFSSLLSLIEVVMLLTVPRPVSQNHCWDDLFKRLEFYLFTIPLIVSLGGFTFHDQKSHHWPLVLD